MLYLAVRRILLLVLLLQVSLLAFAQTPAKDKPEDIKKTITALYAAADKAGNAKDVVGSLKFLSTDYIQINGKGQKITYDQFVSTGQQLLDSVKTISGKTTVNSITIKDATATAEISTDITLTTVRSDGITTTTQLLSTARDFWAKTPKGWLIKRTRILSEEAKQI